MVGGLVGAALLGYGPFLLLLQPPDLSLFVAFLAAIGAGIGWCIGAGVGWWRSADLPGPGVTTRLLLGCLAAAALLVTVVVLHMLDDESFGPAIDEVSRIDREVWIPLVAAAVFVDTALGLTTIVAVALRRGSAAVPRSGPSS